MIRSGLLSLAILISSFGSSAAAAPIVPKAILGSAWSGPQFVQADRLGHVFFLRRDTLQVYPLLKSGALGEPSSLKTVSPENAKLATRAAMSPAGDQWLLVNPAYVGLFVRGEEKPLPPLEWAPWTVGFLRDTPVVAVIPRPTGPTRDLSAPLDVPWFLKLSGERWSPLTRIKNVAIEHLLKTGGMNGAIAENAVFLKSDREGRLWAARQYAYRLQRFTPAGRELTRLTVNGGEVQDQPRESTGIEVKLHGADSNPTEATRNPREEKGAFFRFSAQPAILDLTEGSDGQLYLLVRLADGGIALDRFDTGRMTLERAPLQLQAKGTFTIAAGRDALYIAAFQGKEGRWRVSWDTLAQATWKAVAGVELDGP
jgi:hypothetical protein